jgi:hypothetical protein
MGAEQLVFSWLLADNTRGRLLPYVLEGACA